MIPDSIVVGIVAAFGLVVAGLCGAAVTLFIQLQKFNADNQRLWQWNRALMDHIYRGNPPPPPPPPSGLFD